MKRIYLLTPFPDIISSYITESILGRSEKRNLTSFCIKNLFDFSDSPHHRIDDYPFGGGAGMIIKPEPVFRAYDEIIKEIPNNAKIRVIFPTPDGQSFDQNMAYNLIDNDVFIFICGHYKGIDQRIRDELVTEEVSIGDYVITGGELPALLILDAMVRLVPGVLNNQESAESDSFSSPLLDCPHYTRPEIFRGLESPSVLLSGDHENIRLWKKDQSELKTKIRRPDLWKKYKKLENGK